MEFAKAIIFVLKLLNTIECYNLQQAFKDILLDAGHFNPDAMSPLSIFMAGCHLLCDIDNEGCRGFVAGKNSCRLLRPPVAKGTIVDGYQTEKSHGILRVDTGRCFLQIYTFKSWDDAAKHCMGQGGRLAVVDNNAMYEAISINFDENAYMKGVSVWIGAKSVGNSSVLVWQNGKTATTYFDDTSNFNGCAVFDFSTHLIKTTDCSKRLLSFCEFMK